MRDRQELHDCKYTESKVLRAINVVISGQQFGETALKQADLMETKVRELATRERITLSELHN